MKASASTTHFLGRSMKTMTSCQVTRRAMTLPQQFKMMNDIDELQIETCHGYSLYQSLQNIKSKLKNFSINYNAKQFINTDFIQFYSNITEYVNFLTSQSFPSNCITVVRLHYLINNLFIDLIHFTEVILTSLTSNFDHWDCLILLITIETIVFSLLHLENVIKSLSNTYLNNQSKTTTTSNLQTPNETSEDNLNTQNDGVSSMVSSNPELSPRTKPQRTLSEYLPVKFDENSYTLFTLVDQFINLQRIVQEQNNDWKSKLDQCKILIKKNLKIQNSPPFQTEYNEYCDNMTKAPNTFFDNCSTNKVNYSHCYGWLPLLYKITQEDFFASLIHLIKEDERKVINVGFLLEHWRKVPRAFESKYMSGLYSIYEELLKVHKNGGTVNASLLSMKEEYELPIFKRCIWRYPPQYFYILLNPRFVAQKLTEAHVGIFTKCPPRAIFYSKQMRRAGIGATDLKKKVDILAYWVSQSLYESVQNPLLNKEFHEYFIEIISQLYWLRHNLLATLGLSIGFSSFRLNKFEKPILRNDMSKLRNWVNELTDPKDGSYPNLITAMKELGNPCIPYFGSFQNIFEKVLSADIQDVGVLYLNIGKATEETRRNRIKWSDLIYEDSTYVNSAFEISFNEWCETPWSDSKLFDSMVKSTKFRVLHKNQDIPRRKKCIINLKKTKNGFMVQPTSICRYTKYSPLL
ncbi:hypothetical protein CL6EHI_048620 [Entamoeba histolytica]|uniref:Ras-GEF domain-containing protein n=4 Tax=Entamoeba histolytica TaxID=5759 RepID=C4M2X5_ENTH1|nr:hypothetical protein EHI_048620 [Entamoeba histolytica HM-1:IMSS]EAL47340.2 hypothetical protein EHI_048620 [Entamoeba histolytica HM-1:IMSS]GAT95647.1 hypothetical protein CL6EHI_048620 [Entamoeba histolytica]|eukprot:XP_652726.2 hypothetical protein EHI_048620 [Entamoeba histolytica HM-1:IMSS]